MEAGAKYTNGQLELAALEREAANRATALRQRLGTQRRAKRATKNSSWTNTSLTPAENLTGPGLVEDPVACKKAVPIA